MTKKKSAKKTTQPATQKKTKAPGMKASAPSSKKAPVATKAIAEQLDRLNDNLETIVTELREQRQGARPAAPSEPLDDGRGASK